MLAWRSHIDGAVNIVRTRGREQMCRTKTGMLLFTAVRHHLVTFSLLPLPPASGKKKKKKRYLPTARMSVF